MANSIIGELESAARIILAPPNVVTIEQRKAAEEVYINFCKTRTPYNLCRDILETTTVDFVLFQTATLLKTALIREWVTLPASDILSLRQYLLHYIINRELPTFVREKLLQVIAIMVKRQSCEDFGVDRAQILTEIETLILSGILPRQTLGCSLLAAIMQEYATSLKSSDVGLPWEVHFRAKKCFEATDLPRIFKFCVRSLGQMLQTDPAFNNEIGTLGKQLLVITESVLTWGYISPLLPKRLIGMFEDMHEVDHAPSLRVGPAWRGIIMDPTLLPLFFTTYWKVRDHEFMAFHAMNCLVQFATLSGVTVDSDDAKLEYITQYLSSFLKLVDSIDIKDREALGLSNIIRKMIIFFPSRIMTQLPENMLCSFLEHVSKLTCKFAEGAAQEESLYAEDRLYMEAFDNILEAWSTLLQETQFPKELIEKISIEIFNTYLKNHLSPPDGHKGSRELYSEEIDESEETDRLKFRDQLKTIGVFGRQVAAYTVPLLSNLLEQRIQRLKEHLVRRFHTQSSNISDTAVLDCLFEDLHWLILIAGHVICIDSEGETALIPSEIMRLCIDQSKSGKIDASTSLMLLGMPEKNVNEIVGADETADPLLRLVAAIFRQCEVEKSAAKAKMQQFLSPEVGSTVIWFLNRFSLCYLMPSEDNYYELCPLLVTAFGKDSEGAKWTANFLLDKIYSNIINFSSEITLLTDSVQLLVSLVAKGGDKGCLVARSNGLWDLVNLQSKLDSGSLPQIAKRGLYRAFTLCSSSLEEQAAAEYLHDIINPITTRFKEIVSQDNFNQVYQLENIKTSLIDILESLIGICQGVHVRTVKIVFTILSQILSELSALLNMYHNYQVIVQLILEVFCESARRMLCYLGGNESRKMYEFCYTTIQTFSQCNTNRLTADSTAEEGSFQDILLVLELLTNISTKDCFDLGDQPLEDENAITAADVCLYGLNFIMPLMTVELLKYPQLCSQYYKMITFICEFYPDKVCQLNSLLLRKLFGSIELGLTTFGRDVVTWSLEAIQLLATNIYKQSLQGSHIYIELMPFLKLLMDLALTHQFPSDIVMHASLALYALICIYPEQYKEAVHSLINLQSDSTIAARLAESFTELMSGIRLTCERQSRMKFRDKFDKFIINVHGFLIIK